MEPFKPVMIGDVAVVTNPGAKLLKAVATINGIHDAFDATGVMKFPGKSKESCILCALAVRDFLQRIGFKDAAVRSVGVLVQARRNGEVLHSVGVGLPARFYTDEAAKGRNGSGWNGHLVTTVGKFMIDTTLYP